MPFYSELKRRTDDEKRDRTVAGLRKIRKKLDDHLTDAGSLTDRTKTVRIATWNLRAFGGNGSGGRDYEAMYYIAEIVSHFDIIAIQEVKRSLRDLKRLMRILGPGWDYLATDVTAGSRGNSERMVFVFNTSKVSFKNIAGALTLPTGEKVLSAMGERVRLSPESRLRIPMGTDLSGTYDALTKTKSNGDIVLDCDVDIELPAGTIYEVPPGSALAVTKGTEIERPASGRATIDIPTPVIDEARFRLRLPGGSLDDSFQQFARTPYLVAFQAGWLRINLCTVHIYFGSNDVQKLLDERKAEIRALSKSLGKRAKKDMDDDSQSRTFFAALGDFNIVSAEHETMQALEANGFEVPDELKSIPGTNVEKDKTYDQIAFWRPDADRGYAKLDIVASGVFDYFSVVYTKTQGSNGVYASEVGNSNFNLWRTYKMSDHLPMWVELRSDFSEEYWDTLDD